MAAMKRMARPQGNTPPAQSEIMARLAAAASGGDSQSIALLNSLSFSKTGLVIDRELNQDEWSKLYEAIGSIKSAFQWIIGDWMLYGFEHEWVNSYEDMAAFTGLKDVTVRNYTYVCRNVPASLRSDKLSFGHFQLIAPLEDKPIWIQRAVDEKLSISQLRQAIHGDDPPPPLSKKETNLLSRFVRAIRKDQLTTITDGDMVLMRKAFDRAEQLRKNAMR